MALARRSLVIGGTGMLATATRWLAARSDETVLVARHATAFDAARARLWPLDLDWDDPDFSHAVTRAISVAPIGNALLWLHNPRAIVETLRPHLAAARTVLVMGGMDGRPAAPAWTQGLLTVRLGSQSIPGGRRWLTDAEISAGAIAALETGKSQIVGELRGL